MTKNENDMKILETIICQQNALGARLPEYMDDWRYAWDDEGSLTRIDWSLLGLRGRLSLAGLDMLEVLNCSYNELESLDIKAVPMLKILYCHQNRLTELDVCGVPSLGTLYCDYNQLASLDIGSNSGLRALHCYNNALTSLDISGCLMLKNLYCDDDVKVIREEQKEMEEDYGKE